MSSPTQKRYIDPLYIPILFDDVPSTVSFPKKVDLLRKSGQHFYLDDIFPSYANHCKLYDLPWEPKWIEESVQALLDTGAFIMMDEHVVRFSYHAAVYWKPEWVDVWRKEQGGKNHGHSKEVKSDHSVEIDEEDGEADSSVTNSNISYPTSSDQDEEDYSISLINDEAEATDEPLVINLE